MSCWTYVTGWIECMPFGRTQEEREYILKTVLNHLPVVDGSEEPMYVHIMQAGGYDSSGWGDEYNHKSNVKDVKWINNTQIIDTYNRSHYELQSTYYIFVEGHFRDRQFSVTYRQFMKWLVRLAKRIMVDYVCVKISESWSGRTELIETGSMYDITEDFSWLGKGEKNWCEHLMWKPEDLE